MKPKVICTIALLSAAILLFIIPDIRLPVVDSRTDQYFNEAIQKAGIAYATIRVLNASISVIQHSQVQMEPAGVGISVAVGQVLDPIDDLTERLSDILITAIASLGIQRLVYEMAVSLSPLIIALLCAILIPGIWLLDKNRFETIRKTAVRVGTIVLVIRFFLPASSLANAFMYRHFFVDDITRARQGLSLISEELGTLDKIELPKIDGFTETLKNSAKFLDQAVREISSAVSILTRNMESVMENLLTLTGLYAGVFFIQTIAFPVLMFWFLVKFIDGLMGVALPVVRKRPDPA